MLSSPIIADQKLAPLHRAPNCSGIKIRGGHKSSYSFTYLFFLVLGPGQLWRYDVLKFGVVSKAYQSLGLTMTEQASDWHLGQPGSPPLTRAVPATSVLPARTRPFRQRLTTCRHRCLTFTSPATRSWNMLIHSFAAVTMMVALSISSDVSGSRQRSQSPANARIDPSAALKK